MFSPRTRGCSLYTPTRTCQPKVFPAHAGMFRHTRQAEDSSIRFPRARGDVPMWCCAGQTPHQFSPRTRGCSPIGIPYPTPYYVFPAHAGMFRIKLAANSTLESFPRARGDVPADSPILDCALAFSPRTRGCSVEMIHTLIIDKVFPAHAGMFR